MSSNLGSSTIFQRFGDHAITPPEQRVRGYIDPNGIKKHYKVKMEWGTEQNVYSKFLHKLGIHNDAIVQRVAAQFPDLVSVTNVDGMEQEDIEKTKAHHIWEEVQYLASMHYHVDTHQAVLSKYTWGDALLKEFANGVPEGTLMKRTAPR